MKKLFLVLSSIIMAAALFMLTPLTSQAAGKSEAQALAEVFDATYYAEHYPDVVLAKGDSRDVLLDHYVRHGIYEGRSASATFNAKAYRTRYADIDALYGDDWIKYVTHYVNVGKAEGRDASPLPANYVKDNNTSEYQFLGTYTTRYKDNIPRAVNVGIASAAINGVVVAPGAEFSFTNTIPPRTVENGYQEAMMFVNKEKTTGVGGGICQVSSTLYACMKTIGLPATERHAHSLPVDYVPEGWDATISGQILDLKFVNTYSDPLMIVSSANGGTLTVSLYLKK